MVVEPGEVVEVGAVRDRDHASARGSSPHLLGEGVGDGDDRAVDELTVLIDDQPDDARTHCGSSEKQGEQRKEDDGVELLHNIIPPRLISPLFSKRPPFHAAT